MGLIANPAQAFPEAAATSNDGDRRDLKLKKRQPLGKSRSQVI